MLYISYLLFKCLFNFFAFVYNKKLNIFLYNVIKDIVYLTFNFNYNNVYRRFKIWRIVSM